MADAFITATVKEMKRGKVDHHAGTGNWIARRILLAAESNSSLGLVKEYSRSPTRPRRELDSKTLNAINDGIMEVVSKLTSGRKVLLTDEESLGLD